MPILSLRFYEGRYAISRFILDRANALGLTRRQLVERLGFSKRLAKGHSVLSEILLTGTVPSYVTTLADALEVDQPLLDAVLSATERQLEAERQAELLARENQYHDCFCPYLQVKTERSRPSPIFVAAMLPPERLRFVYLPEEINSLKEGERQEVIRDSIRQHYRQTGGRVPAFGCIEGYYFIRFAGFGAMDFGALYSVDGVTVGDMMAVKRIPEASLGLKRGDKRLGDLLRNSGSNILDDHE
jgi:hypothetical protein